MGIVSFSPLRATASARRSAAVARTAATGLARCTRASAAARTASTSAAATPTGTTTAAAAATPFAPSQTNKERSDVFDSFNYLIY